MKKLIEELEACIEKNGHDKKISMEAVYAIGSIFSRLKAEVEKMEKEPETLGGVLELHRAYQEINKRMAHYEGKVFTIKNGSIEIVEPARDEGFTDYDSGLLNDYGKGNVNWWHDYIRAELDRCNQHWREQIDSRHPAPEQVEPLGCKRCGTKLTSVRGKFPGDASRDVCACCLLEALEDMVEQVNCKTDDSALPDIKEGL